MRPKNPVIASSFISFTSHSQSRIISKRLLVLLLCNSHHKYIEQCGILVVFNLFLWIERRAYTLYKHQGAMWFHERNYPVTLSLDIFFFLEASCDVQSSALVSFPSSSLSLSEVHLRGTKTSAMAPLVWARVSVLNPVVRVLCYEKVSFPLIDWTS